jgi:hypothetical protein
MFVPNKLENPFSNLIYGLFLVLFGLFALLVAWAMWRSIDNWLFLTFVLISFAVPAFAAFFLGVGRLYAIEQGYMVKIHERKGPSGQGRGTIIEPLPEKGEEPSDEF